eukprot:bmy_15623T0
MLTLDSMFPKAALLLGLTVVGIHVRTIQKEFVDISKDHDYFAVSVEFAVVDSTVATRRGTPTSCWRSGEPSKK